jgi:hypothetical protein
VSEMERQDPNQPDGSLYDALFSSVAESQEVQLSEVRRELVHREVFDDFFWTAWDRAVSDATTLFCQVTGRDRKEED